MTGPQMIPSDEPVASVPSSHSILTNDAAHSRMMAEGSRAMAEKLREYARKHPPGVRWLAPINQQFAEVALGRTSNDSEARPVKPNERDISCR